MAKTIEQLNKEISRLRLELAVALARLDAPGGQQTRGRGCSGRWYQTDYARENWTVGQICSAPVGTCASGLGQGEEKDAQGAFRVEAWTMPVFAFAMCSRVDSDEPLGRIFQVLPMIAGDEGDLQICDDALRISGGGAAGQ